MSLIDVLLILGYFIVVIGLGFYYSRRASKDLNAYFLGGNRIHWLGLAMSGSVLLCIEHHIFLLRLAL